MKGMRFDSKQFVGTTSLREYAVPINIAKDEIVLLHKVILNGETTAGNSIRCYLNNKTAKGENLAPAELENALIHDTGTFWRSAYHIAATSLNLTYIDILTLAPPLLLIRPPRAIIHGGGAAVYFNMWFYYTKETVSKDELSKLMLKRHH